MGFTPRAIRRVPQSWHIWVQSLKLPVLGPTLNSHSKSTPFFRASVDPLWQYVHDVKYVNYYYYYVNDLKLEVTAVLSKAFALTATGAPA